MTADRDYTLVDRFLADEGRVFLTGIQALARLPLEQLRADRRAGLHTAGFVSGYQGSPLGGYGDAVARASQLAPELGVRVRPGMNEEYGATAVMGSQLAAAQPDCRYDGIVGIWYGKAPGVDRAADALRHAVYAGSSMNGGAVALVGDDPAAKSSTVPSSSAGLLFDMHMPILYPGDPAEALAFGRHAIMLSRATGLWVAMKIVADVADATASIDLHPEYFRPVLPLVDGERYQHTPDGRLLTPHTVEIEREIVEVRYELARRYASDNGLNVLVVDPPDAWIGIASSGITYREVREALSRLGLASDESIAACGIRILKMGMPMPFNAETIRNFARGLREVLVVEEKSPNLESLLKDALYDSSTRPRVVGKHDEAGRPLCPAYGALDADRIVPILRQRLGETLRDKLTPEATAPPPAAATPIRAQRIPFFCSGCPHNRSTQVPEGTLVGAGIGCHTMTLLMDPARVGDIAGITCMGNEGTQWIGMADFLERQHFIQNLGDGTYFHSGQLAVQATVSAGVNITYKLLYNGTVAMTGGQDPEAQLDVPSLSRVLLAQGVARVLITADEPGRYDGVDLPRGVEVWARQRILEAQETLAKVPGTTVLIHDQYCAAEARRDRKRGRLPTPPQRVFINSRLCEGCGDCGRVSNCLSVQPISTRFGPKTAIDQTTCNYDYSCLEGDCPSFMTVKVKDEETADGSRAGAPAPQAKRALPEPPADLPEPSLVVPGDDFSMRIIGIGGTGVVTVAQTIGTAAMLDGFHVRGLDQIGLSQKAGPVVSDVRLSRSAPPATNRLGRAQADLLLAFDSLGAASENALQTAQRERTAVVGSATPTPTGEMITHLDVKLPSQEVLAERIALRTRADIQHWADSQLITEELFGSATTANLFVVGMAFQAGCLPIPAEQLERAITLNGVAVDANLAAFRWGRTQIAQPERVAEARAARHVVAVVTPPPLPTALQARIDALSDTSNSSDTSAETSAADALRSELECFARELIAWQDERAAAAWLYVLEHVAAAERRVAPASTDLLQAVAANLYKLTAYKDEYEVARLMTDDEALAEAREIVRKGGTLSWRLHPPLLRALGLGRKISIGAWAAPGIRLLARGKRLRGTPLDLFGYTAVRRVERELPGEYQAALERITTELSDSNLARAVEIARLPDLVRGYEEIKLENVAHYRRELTEKLTAFGVAHDTAA